MKQQEEQISAGLASINIFMSCAPWQMPFISLIYALGVL